MKVTNVHGLPEALVKAVSFRKHTPGRLSATTMLNGMKNIHLSDRHWDDLEEDVSERLWALFGKTGHSLLEDEGADEVTEEFLSYEMDGITVTGMVDNYNLRTGRISDYKFITVYKILKHDFEDWYKQGMIYAWLLRKNGFEAKTCRFIAIIKDHKRREAKHKESYPKIPLYVYDFDVTDHGLAEIEEFIKGKIAEYKQFKDMTDDEIPPCTAKERWERPTTYAVMKPGNKRATRVTDTIAEADKIAADLGKGCFVETRVGESVRCLDYCACADFCNFYRDIVPVAEEQEAVPA